MSTSWLPVQLAPIVAGIEAGEIVGPVPEFMARVDGVTLLYGGEVHSLAGEPESCKGWLALAAVSSSVTAGASVLYIDCEDTPASIIGRLLALGTAPEAIVGNLVYVRPCDPLTSEALTALLGAAYALAVIDGLSEAYALLGLDPYLNADAAKFLAMLPRPIAERGAAVLLIDHVVKSREARGRFAIGAQHKLAGIAAAYSAEVIKAPSRTDAGMVKIKVEKDRHGHVRNHAQAGVIALAHITPADNGESVSVTLELPDAGTTESGDFRPTVLMGRVARYVEDAPGASRNDVIRDVPGKRAYLDEALRHLIADGYIERRKEGQAFRHYPIRAFDDADRGPEAQPRPNRGPEQSPATEAPRPSPTRGAPAGPGDGNGHSDLPDGWSLADLENIADEQKWAAG